LKIRLAVLLAFALGGTAFAADDPPSTFARDFLKILRNPQNEAGAFLQSDLRRPDALVDFLTWLDRRVQEDARFWMVLSGDWSNTKDLKEVSRLILERAQQEGLTLQRGWIPRRLAIHKASHKGGVVEIKVLNAFRPRTGAYADIVERGTKPQGQGYMLVGRGSYESLEILFDVYGTPSGSKKIGIPFVERDASTGWRHALGVLDDQTSAGESAWLADARLYLRGLPSATTLASLWRMEGDTRGWHKIPVYSQKRANAGIYGTGQLRWWTFWRWVRVDPIPY